MKRKQNSKITYNQTNNSSPKLKQSDTTARSQNAPGSSTDNPGFEGEVHIYFVVSGLQ